MELIAYAIIGCAIGSLTVITILKIFKSKSIGDPVDIDELIRQSKERQKTNEDLSKQLDELLEDVRESKK
jgi:hypothetical protein